MKTSYPLTFVAVKAEVEAVFVWHTVTRANVAIIIISSIIIEVVIRVIGRSSEREDGEVVQVTGKHVHIVAVTVQIDAVDGHRLGSVRYHVI